MIRKLEWSNGNIFAYQASGKISKQDNKQIFCELDDAIKKYGKVRIFVSMPKFAWPAPNALGIRFSFAKKHLLDIEKFAVVSNNSALAFLFLFFSIIPGFRYRLYSIKDELLAKTWISTKHI